MNEIDRQTTEIAMFSTNAQAKIIFANAHFLTLLDYPHLGKVVWEPFYEILRIDNQVGKELMKEVERHGSITNQLLLLQQASGSLVQVVCDGNANYSTHRKFLGADFSLHEVTEDEIASDEKLVRGKMYQRLAEQILTRAAADDINKLHLAIYFVAQMQALFVLAARVVGLKAQQRVEASINQLSQENAYPISVEDGHVKIDANWVDASAFRLLLAETSASVAGIIGARIVEAERSQVELQLDEEILETARQFGL